MKRSKEREGEKDEGKKREAGIDGGKEGQGRVIDIVNCQCEGSCLKRG